MHNPDDKPSNCFILLTFSNLFNFHAIHEREPWNGMVVVDKTKRERIVSHQLGVSTGYGDAHQ